jgi:hypothetical protein
MFLNQCKVCIAFARGKIDLYTAMSILLAGDTEKATAFQKSHASFYEDETPSTAVAVPLTLMNAMCAKYLELVPVFTGDEEVLIDFLSRTLKFRVVFSAIEVPEDAPPNLILVTKEEDERIAEIGRLNLKPSISSRSQRSDEAVAQCYYVLYASTEVATLIPFEVIIRKADDPRHAHAAPQDSCVSWQRASLFTARREPACFF